MLLYGKILKLAELSHFLEDFWHFKNQLLALKIEPLNEIQQNSGFSKLKEFLIGGKTGIAMEKY